MWFVDLPSWLGAFFMDAMVLFIKSFCVCVTGREDNWQVTSFVVLEA